MALLDRLLVPGWHLVVVLLEGRQHVEAFHILPVEDNFQLVVHLNLMVLTFVNNCQRCLALLEHQEEAQLKRL